MKLIWLLILAGLGAGGWWALGAFETDPPIIQTLATQEYVGTEYMHELTVIDDGRGIETLQAWIETGDERFDLLSTRYDGTWHSGADLKTPRRVQVTLDRKQQPIPDGRATLIAEATDFSFRRNMTRIEVPLILDSRAPRVTVLTGLTYVRRGGSELVVYELDEASERHGVRVGDLFFPGFIHPENPKQFLAFYALPPGTPDGTIPTVVARDRAQNETSVPLSISVIDSRPTSDRIELTENFMRRKVAEITGEESGDLLADYLKINRDLRQQNADKIREICSESSDDRLWTGPFLQMPGSKVGAGFAEARTYLFEGREVDRQTHLGYDLASTARAEIPAANDGVVVFADELGIYGRTVLIDHGLSLFSLYGHLSEFSVDKGQAVARGQTIGRSGATGLAGGDHLHFGVLLAGTFVDPIEWFDAKWIAEHLESKLSRTKEPQPAAAAEFPASPDATAP